ncbi:MAG: Ig-like domain-containing protein, partial [Thermoanaerobaculia bacterium]
MSALQRKIGGAAADRVHSISRNATARTRNLDRPRHTSSSRRSSALSGLSAALLLFFALLPALPLFAQSPTEVVVQEDFQSYPTQANPQGWVDTSVGNPHPQAEGLYKTWPDPTQGNKGANVVYGTKQSSGKPEGRNPRIGTFSTLVDHTFGTKGRFEYRGRFIRTRSDARIGLTFLSSYPDSDHYYLLGLWSQATSSKLTMQLFSFGAGTLTGTIDSNFTPEPGKWIRFLIQVDGSDAGNKIRARFWIDGTDEPSGFTIEAEDSAAGHLASGRIGIWAAVKGDAYFDELFAKYPVDITAPAISFLESGTTLNDGAKFNRDVAPAIQVVDDTDPSPSWSATLDGQPFTSGTTVAAEGTHLLAVDAADSAGNASHAQLSFFIDKTAPLLAVTESGAPLADGAIFDHDAVVSIVVTDISATTDAILLDGQPYTSLTPITTEAQHELSVSSIDELGNGPTTFGPVHFFVDETAPVVTILQNGATLQEGSAFNHDVTGSLAIEDLTPTTSSMALDGQPYASGTPISTDGSHTLAATVTDSAGHTTTAGPLHFILDEAGPTVTILESGQPFPAAYFFNRDVVASVSVDDIAPHTATMSLDGQPYTEGTPITAEGPHEISAHVTDTAGNDVTVGPIALTIDKTPPVVTLLESGQPFAAGQTFPRDVVADATATDTISKATLTLTLDGQTYVASTPVTAEGEHTFAATAVDQGGNTASASVSFVIDETPPELSLLLGGQPFPADLWTNQDVTPELDIVDISTTTTDATLDGAPYAIGAPVSLEGEHVLDVAVTDAAGWTTTLDAVTFHIDRVPPALTVTSHQQGQVLPEPRVVLAGGADDAVSVTVNGQTATVDATARTWT